MKSTSILYSLVLGLVFSSPALALKTDRDQPAQIESDDTEIDFKTGIRTLTNNVLVVQGTLRVKADKLVASYDTGSAQLVKAVATGSLARFKQRPDNKPDDVEGWAKTITIDYPKNTITLVGKAALKQGASTARGETIVYNMETDKLKIKGSNIGLAGKDGKAAPKRKIEDPFKDDAKGPDESSNASGNTSKAKAQTVEPVKSGRSRLILQPKKVEKKVDKKDDTEDQSNQND